MLVEGHKNVEKQYKTKKVSYNHDLQKLVSYPKATSDIKADSVEVFENVQWKGTSPNTLLSEKDTNHDNNYDGVEEEEER